MSKTPMSPIVLAALLPLLSPTPGLAEEQHRPLGMRPGGMHWPVAIPGIPKATHWVNRPAEFEVTRQGIEIVASEQTNKYNAADGSFTADSAHRLLFEADADFTLSAAIAHPFAGRWDAGALILEGDADHWIKLCFEKDYTGAKRVVSVVTKGTSDDANSIAFDTNQAYLQIAKMGDVVFLYASDTGKDWYLVRIVSFQFHGKLWLGLLAQAPEAKANKVSFSHIKYKAAAMKDFWKGE